MDTHLPSLCSVTSLAKRKCDGCFSIFDFNWYSLLIVFSSRGCLAKANGLDGKALLGFGVEGPKNWGSIGRGERTIWVKQRIVKQPRGKKSLSHATQLYKPCRARQGKSTHISLRHREIVTDCEALRAMAENSDGNVTSRYTRASK